jgi:hypothetical protein
MTPIKGQANDKETRERHIIPKSDAKSQHHGPRKISTQLSYVGLTKPNHAEAHWLLALIQIKAKPLGERSIWMPK